MNNTEEKKKTKKKKEKQLSLVGYDGKCWKNKGANLARQPQNVNLLKKPGQTERI